MLLISHLFGHFGYIYVIVLDEKLGIIKLIRMNPL